MKLYYSPGACSLSPHIALHEAGLAFEPVLASTKSHKLQDGTDYYGINPLGYVPLLELDDGTRLREGPAIVQYIADLAPIKNLAPAAGTLSRATATVIDLLLVIGYPNVDAVDGHRRDGQGLAGPGRPLRGRGPG